MIEDGGNFSVNLFAYPERRAIRGARCGWTIGICVGGSSISCNCGLLLLASTLLLLRCSNGGASSVGVRGVTLGFTFFVTEFFFRTSSLCRVHFVGFRLL